MTYDGTEFAVDGRELAIGSTDILRFGESCVLVNRKSGGVDGPVVDTLRELAMLTLAGDCCPSMMSARLKEMIENVYQNQMLQSSKNQGTYV